MPDLVITPADVRASNGARRGSGVAGAAITAGQTLYADGADQSRLKLANANGSAATAAVVGIALQSVGANQPLDYVTEDDDFTPGATLVAGTVYVTSATPGGITPVADLTTVWYTTVLFFAKSAKKAVMPLVRARMPI